MIDIDELKRIAEGVIIKVEGCNKKYGIKVKLYIKSSELTENNVKDWFERLLFFTPSLMSGKYLTGYRDKKYNHKKFVDGMKEELNGSNVISLSLSDGSNENKNLIELRRDDIFSDITILYSRMSLVEKNIDVLKVINDFIVKYNSVVAYACSEEDFLLQNEKNADNYKWMGKSLEGVRLIKNPPNPNWRFVDIEYNPGHSHYAHNLWFGSCWAMWFGKEYFKYIPKEKLLKFKECYANDELENGSIRILLHENVWDYDKPENRERQWAFRRKAGVDEAAEKLQKTKMPIDNPDPAIVFFEGKCEHGGVSRVKCYFNGKGENVEKSKAKKCVITEYDKSGNIVWSIEEDIN